MKAERTVLYDLHQEVFQVVNKLRKDTRRQSLSIERNEEHWKG